MRLLQNYITVWIFTIYYGLFTFDSCLPYSQIRLTELDTVQQGLLVHDYLVCSIVHFFFPVKTHLLQCNLTVCFTHPDKVACLTASPELAEERGNVIRKIYFALKCIEVCIKNHILQ